MLKKVISFPILALLIIGASPVFAQGTLRSVSKSLKSHAIPVSSFKHSDIGNPSIKGTVKNSENGFDISAAGTDIWGVKDEFNFVYVERTGDFDLVSRIAGLRAAHMYTKAGLMARESLTAGSRHIYFQVFSDNNARNKNNGGYEFQYRQVKDSSMKAIYPKSATGTPEFPVSFPDTWIRLQRVKNDFTGYCSTDGKNWKVYTTYSMELPAKIYLGLAVTSHNPSHAAWAKFRDIAELK